MMTLQPEKASSHTSTAGGSVDLNNPTGYQGNDRLLLGIVLAVFMFWLFASTMGTVAPVVMDDINSDREYLTAASMNLAVSITALFSGLFVVLMGKLADRFGRVKVARIGILLGIAGGLFLIFAAGPLALPLLLIGRALQGISTAMIMPSTIALVKAFWDGPGRQRAVSMWSIGSWGGAGISALFGGTAVQFVGWRGIFVASIIVAIISLLLLHGTPESRANLTPEEKALPFDWLGLALFVLGLTSGMIVLLFGSQIGWGSPWVIGLGTVAGISVAIFLVVEMRAPEPLVDFSLFKDGTFAGAVISNLLMNGVIGILFISQQLIQLAGHKADGSLYTAWDAGLLTIGYGVFIILFIRVGEKFLQKVGPRLPMIVGACITAVSCFLLMGTHLLITQYVVVAVIAYCLFGLGLAIYATPSTDGALASLPVSQAGAGGGIYKMASSLGNALGTAISLAVFTALLDSGTTTTGFVVEMAGRQDNANIREAAMATLSLNLVFLLLAIVAVVALVPKGKLHEFSVEAGSDAGADLAQRTAAEPGPAEPEAR